MHKKLLIVIGVGLAAATTSTYLFYQFLAESAESRSGGIEIRHSIVVAARDLDRGTQLKPSDLAVAPWAGENLPAWAFTEQTALVGEILSYDVRQHEPLMDSRLSISGRGGAAGRIPQGMRAVSINVAEYAGVNFLVQPSDRVDVMVSNGPPSDGNSKLHVKTILQNVEVLVTGREPVHDGKRSDRPVATLLVNAEDAEALSIADHAGFIRLALRNPLDGEVHITSGGRLQDLTKRSAARSSRRNTRVAAGREAERTAEPQPSTPRSQGEADVAALLKK